MCEVILGCRNRFERRRSTVEVVDDVVSWAGPTQYTRTVLGTPLAVDDPASFRLASMRYKYSGAEIERNVETTKQPEKVCCLGRVVGWGGIISLL